jgi:hypothetical protein
LPAPPRLGKANRARAPRAIPEFRDAFPAKADLECPLPHTS